MGVPGLNHAPKLATHLEEKLKKQIEKLGYLKAIWLEFVVATQWPSN